MIARRERWRALPRPVRWFALAGLVLLGLRLALALALPLALGWWGRSHRLELDWQSLRLALHSGELDLRGLVVRPRGADATPAAAWLTLERAHVDLALRDLFAGRVRLQRAELDGLALLVERRADGSSPWSEHFWGDPEAARAREPERPLDLGWPIAIDRLRANHLELHWVDAAVEGGCDARVVLDLRGEELGRADREGTLRLDATSAGVLEHLGLELASRSGGREAHARLALGIQGLHPAALAGYLAALGIAPDAAEIEAHARLALEVHPHAQRAGALAARVDLDDLAWSSSAGEALALTHGECEAEALGPAVARGLRLALEKPRLALHHDAQGELCLGGLRSLSSSREAPPTPAPASASAPLDWSLAGFELREGRVEYADARLRGAEPLALELARLTLDAFDPSAASFRTTLALQARVPAVAESAQLELALSRDGERLGAEFRGALPQVHTARLQPFLAGAGLELMSSTLRVDSRADASLERASDGSWSGEVHLGPVTVSDANRASSLHALDLGDVRFDPAAGTLHLGASKLQGLCPTLGHDGEGRGFVFPLRRARGTPAPATSSKPPTSAGSAQPLRLDLGELHVESCAVTIEDARPDGGRTSCEARLQLDALPIGVTRPGLSQSWEIQARVDAPGLIDRTHVRGDFGFDEDGFGARVALELAGISAERARELFEGPGLELHWGHPGLKAQIEARVADGKLAAHVRDLAFEDGRQRYLAVQELDVDGLQLDDPLRALGMLRAKGVELVAGRDREGAWFGLGLRRGSRREDAQAAAAADAGGELSFPRLPELGWTSLALDDLQLVFREDGPQGYGSHRLAASLDCGALRTGDPATPMRLAATLRAPDWLGTLRCEGSAEIAPAHLALDLALEARELTPTLGGYLPPGVQLRSSADRLACTLHARLEPRGATAIAARVELDDLAWGDDQVPERLAFTRAALDLARASRQEIEIGELALAGLRGRVTRGADGSTTLGGLRLVPSAAPAAASVAAAPEARVPAPLPRLLLDRLSLELAGLEFTDDARGDAARPLKLACTLATEEPLVLVDTAPEGLPPLRCVMRGRADPLASSVELRLALTQWLVQPELELELRAEGLRGAGLTELAPQLAERLDGGALDGGELQARLHVRCAFARRGLGRFDFARPFAAELTLEGLALRAAPGGAQLAGLERAHAEFERIDPTSGSVRAKSVELTRPFVRLERTAAGLSTCGLLLRSAPGSPAPDAPATDAPRGPTTRGDPPPAAAQAELGLARLTASGLDLVYLDRTTPSAVRVPLVDLDVEVRNLGSRALSEPQEIPFSASLRAGRVELPAHGAERAAAERELFGGCELNGRLKLFPEPAGWFRLGLEGLELTNFRALAEASGVALEDGRLDLALRGRLSGARGLSLETVAVLSELELSEEAGGPIQRALQLPSPTQAVLALVRDLEGNLRLPARVHLESGAPTRGEIVQAALASVSAILTRALLSAPFRVVGGLAGGLAGDDAARRPSRVEEHILAFDAGSATAEDLDESLRLQIAGKLSADDRLHVRLEHAFSAEDLARARVLANPALGDCRELSQRLRQKKVELSRARAEAAALVRVDLAVGRESAARAGCERLRAIDAELGRSEEALDRVHELLRSGSERHAEARLRAAARALANQRLERVQASLAAAGIDPARIELRPLRLEDGGVPRGLVRVRLVREE